MTIINDIRARLREEIQAARDEIKQAACEMNSGEDKSVDLFTALIKRLRWLEVITAAEEGWVEPQDAEI